MVWQDPTLYPGIAGRRTEKIVDERKIERRRMIFTAVSLILLAIGLFFTIF